MLTIAVIQRIAFIDFYSSLLIAKFPDFCFLLVVSKYWCSKEPISADDNQKRKTTFYRLRTQSRDNQATSAPQTSTQMSNFWTALKL